MSETSTASYKSSEGVSEHVLVRRPFIVVALAGETPFRPSTRISFGRELRVNFVRGRGSVSRKHAGGESSCVVPLTDSALSAGHAFIARNEFGQFWLWDCGSKNGTFLEGVKLESPMRLREGDVIGLGSTLIVFSSAQLLDSAGPTASVSEDTALCSLNPRLERIFAEARVAAQHVFPILIEGQAGTGKRTVARALHGHSSFSGAFVEVQARNLLERLTALRDAEGGTLYLTNLDELQDAEAFSVIENLVRGELNQEGGSSAQIRVMASGSPRALAQLPSSIQRAFEGNVFSLPPVRQRREDLGQLVRRVLTGLGVEKTVLRRSFGRAIFGYEWPGNLHELTTAMRHAVSKGQNALSSAHLPEPVRAFERHARSRRVFVSQVEEHHGNVSSIARTLNIDRKQVHRIANRYGINFDTYRVKIEDHDA